MKISNKITEQIGKLITGDIGPAPYLSGPRLVNFYYDCGYNDNYGEVFPSRWIYSTEKIEESNGTERLKIILEEFVDPRRYGGDEEFVDTLVTDINRLIKYDGYQLKKQGDGYKVSDIKGTFIYPNSISKISHEFVKEQIEKCQQKITLEDFNGAITNSRTLCEAVLIHIIETRENSDIKNHGNLIKHWKQAKKALKMDLKKEEYPDFIFQVLTGLDSTINGLAGISNNAGDRHANKFITKKHHAKLAVNSTMTFCDFLIDVLNDKEKNEQ